MAISTRDPSAQALVRAAKDRSAPEAAVVLLFGPLARALVRVLLPLRAPPSAVVLANVAAGLGAAWALGSGALAAAALLLQLKTVLDNADGLLARASGRVTLLGRYLDTEGDLLVNAAVFASLGHVTGEPWLALAGFCALTLLLGVGFNLARLGGEARGRDVSEPAGSGGPVEAALERLYRVLFGPQDRALRAVSMHRLERVLAGVENPATRRRAELAYHDGLLFSYLANTGLSTQLLVLGLCLAVGAPEAYLWLALAAILPLPLLQARREGRARRALRGAA